MTSKKIIPVSADVVFGLNTTNSIDWTEYQQVDENRIFNVDQTGHNLRVGIKFISPNRSTIEPTAFGEYGPYGSSFYINTVDFDNSSISAGLVLSTILAKELAENKNLQEEINTLTSVTTQIIISEFAFFAPKFLE